jgi:glycosyltransferase involved in cell wall biosynthesis
MREKISACITACNEELNIRRCLESVRWADEIIVVDSFSTDRTVEVCRRYTPSVFQHAWLGYIGQKNMVKDMASHPWVLFVDADEEVSPGLREAIRFEFDSGSCQAYAGYEFPRMVHYLGRWIRHGDWYPDIKLRLLRKDLCYCGGKEPHDQMMVKGLVKRLVAPLHHYTYVDISDQIVTLDRFSSISAHTQHGEGRRSRLFDLLFRPGFRFFRGYILKRGFLDGLPGYIIAKSAAFGTFAKYAKLWELERGVSPLSTNDWKSGTVSRPVVRSDADPADAQSG